MLRGVGGDMSLALCIWEFLYAGKRGGGGGGVMVMVAVGGKDGEGGKGGR